MKPIPSNKKILTCNSFDGAPAGVNGTVNYQTPLNTPNPINGQDPNKFNTVDNNKALGSASNTSKDVPDQVNMGKEVDAIFSSYTKSR